MKKAIWIIVVLFLVLGGWWIAKRPNTPSGETSKLPRAGARGNLRT